MEHKKVVHAIVAKLFERVHMYVTPLWLRMFEV